MVSFLKMTLSHNASASVSFSIRFSGGGTACCTHPPQSPHILQHKGHATRSLLGNQPKRYQVNSATFHLIMSFFSYYHGLDQEQQDSFLGNFILSLLEFLFYTFREYQLNVIFVAFSQSPSYVKMLLHN